jgi:hypothetical protein
VSVLGSTGSLKVAVIFPFTAIAVAVSAGVVSRTVGAARSAVAPVVNVKTWSVPSALPARSDTAAATVAV